MERPAVSVIILACDEEANLPACLESLEGLAAEVFVVDSGSRDRTTEIARRAGASVFYHPWTNYATQFNWALDNVPASADWVIRLDADEVLSPALRSFIASRLECVPDEVTGIEIPRQVCFMGRSIRHGGVYPLWLLRIWRRGSGRCEDRWMDEHMRLTSGRMLRVKADLLHSNYKGLKDWLVKHVGYAERECLDLSRPGDTSVHLHRQARRKRWLKEHVYSRLPLFARAWLYWAYRYFLRLGFLDGPEGFAYHFLQALWYRSLVDAVLLERRSAQMVPSYNGRPSRRGRETGKTWV